MRDLINNIKASQHFNPINSTVTRTSTTIDLQGYDAATVLFSIGASGDTLSGSIYWTLKLTHSDDDSVYSDAAVGDLIGASVATVVIDSTAKDEAVYGFGYRGAKRYLRAVATPTGTHSTGTPIGMIALRGYPSSQPVV